MVQLSVKINGEIKRTEISATTLSRLGARVFLSGKPFHYFLKAVVQKYGELNEGNIEKYLEEHKSF